MNGPGAPHADTCECSICKPVLHWNLLQLRAATRCEKAGMKHSSGRSARKRAAIWLGLKQNATHDEVIAAINKELKI